MDIFSTRSYGAVYKARHNQTQTVVAVKSLHLVNQDLQELNKEIDIMKELDSEYVVRYFGNFLKNNVMWVSTGSFNYLEKNRFLYSTGNIQSISFLSLICTIYPIILPYQTTLQIIMEYCSLGSCRDIMNLRNKPYTEEQIAVIIRDALHGLSYLHGQKKIHRDIKADNILMNDLGECKLGN